MGMQQKSALPWSISSVLLHTFIVLSLFAACILGGIPLNKNNAKGEHGEDTLRPKRQETTAGMGVNLFYTSQCEGRTMDLRCRAGKVIMIEWANFGRTDTETCPGYGPVDDTNCRSEGLSYEIVSTMCNNKASCSIRVSSNIFDDNCPNTVKYLEVQFECIGAPTTTTLLPTTTPTPPTTTIAQPTTKRPTKEPNPTEGEITTAPGVRTTTKMKTNPPPQPIVTTVQPSEKVTTQRVRTTPKMVTEPPVPATTLPQMCPAVVERGISWPETRTHNQVTRPCPEGSTGHAVWHCEGVPARWWPEAGPDLSACVSVWVQNITKLVKCCRMTSSLSAKVL